MSGKAILISNKYPFPTDDGKKTVLAGFASFLLEHYGAADFVYVVVGRKSGAIDESKSGRTLFIDPPGRFEQLLNLVRVPFSRDSRTLQEAMTWSRSTCRRLHALVEEIRPELLLLDTIRIGQYFPADAEARPYTRILYMDDLFHVRFERLLKIARDYSNVELDPAGTFAPNLPSIAQKVLRAGLVHRPLFRFEMARVRQRELSSPRQFDRCLLINPNEAQTLALETGAKNIAAVKPVLPNGEKQHDRTFDGAPNFLVFGSLRHPVYRASVIRLIDSCMDEIVRLLPQARIRIVGAGADQAIQQRAERYAENIELAGFVDDLDALFASSCALLVPMLTAGGLKLKALTALHYGLPMITTAAGVDGIDVRNGRDCIVEDDFEKFPLHMKSLSDVERNRKMSAHARRTYLAYYSPERVCAEYEQLFSHR